MADIASIARPYAKAVFDLASESKKHDEWQAALDNLATIAQDEDFQTAVASPSVKPSQLEEMIHAIVGKTLPTGGDNFVKLLAQNGRLDTLPELTSQYTQLLLESRKAVEAEVITARALSAKQNKALIEALESRLGVSVSVNETIDESLIGGAIIKAGDLVIDGSAKGRVEKLAIALQ